MSEQPGAGVNGGGALARGTVTVIRPPSKVHDAMIAALGDGPRWVMTRNYCWHYWGGELKTGSYLWMPELKTTCPTPICIEIVLLTSEAPIIGDEGDFPRARVCKLCRRGGEQARYVPTVEEQEREAALERLRTAALSGPRQLTKRVG